jgi:hypothetical protein
MSTVTYCDKPIEQLDDSDLERLRMTIAHRMSMAVEAADEVLAQVYRSDLEEVVIEIKKREDEANERND